MSLAAAVGRRSARVAVWLGSLAAAAPGKGGVITERGLAEGEAQQARGVTINVCCPR